MIWRRGSDDCEAQFPTMSWVNSRMTKKLHEEHEEVVHYTSASGLHGIVTSNTLWASHTSFINDNEEVVGFFSRVLPMILRPVFEGYVAESKDLKKRVQDAYQLGVDLFDHWLKKIADAFKEAEVRASDHYVASFCTTKDAWISQHGLLSQWRGYGLDGSYAIVFDRERLGALLVREGKMYHEEQLFLGDVQYRLAENINVEDKQVQKHIKQIMEGARAYWMTGDIGKVYPAFDCITLLSAFCKHRGFEEEQEFRIVITEPSVEKGQDTENTDAKPYRKAHNHLRNGVTVPCIHLFEDQKLNTLPIQRVIVGPHPEKQQRKKAVDILLHNHGIDAKVSVSDTPFRGE